MWQSWHGRISRIDVENNNDTEVIDNAKSH